MSGANVCGGCGLAVRVRRRAFVLGKGMAYVCRGCVRGGLTVVAPETVEKVVTRVAASDEVKLALQNLKGLRRLCDDDRRAEGLDQAIEILARAAS